MPKQIKCKYLFILNREIDTGDEINVNFLLLTEFLNLLIWNDTIGEMYAEKEKAQVGPESVKVNSALDERNERKICDGNQYYFVLQAVHGSLSAEKNVQKRRRQEKRSQRVKEYSPVPVTDPG